MTIDSDEPLALLGGLSARAFLRDYWQKKPLLVRQAMPGFQSPPSPEELAGLACEEAVISRLVRERDGGKAWTVRHGPFHEEVFLSLPDSHWTLLVSDVEKHLPELRAWLAPFRFIPDWRMDDLMISYAAPGGSVGPHVDQYDVFLLQAHGRRRWQIDTAPANLEDCLPGLDLRILRRFRASHEWILEPGDMLYLPPLVAHHGVAVDACMTWSVGFRAPAWRDLMAAWVDTRYESLPGDARYGDPDLEYQNSPGELSPAVLARLVAGLRHALEASDADLARWLGAHLTEPKAELLEHLPGAGLLTRDEACALLDAAVPLERHGAARLAWMHMGDAVHLYVNGREHVLDARAEPLARALCDAMTHDGRTLAARAGDIPGARALLQDLCMAGVLLRVPAE